MKPNLLITALIALSMQGLYAGNQTSTSAQEQQGSTPGPQTSTEQAGSQQAPREVKYSKLKDANIVSKSGENLGKLDDVLFNPRTGKIQFAILGSGGLFGLGEKRVPVPWQAINVTSEKEFTINVDKQKLKSAPTVDKAYSELQRPGEYVAIYKFYEIPVESGAAESPSGSQQGSGASSSQNSSSSGSNQQQ